MNADMRLYSAYYSAHSCAEDLLTAHHVWVHLGRESQINLEAAERRLREVAEALGYTLTPINSETKSERIDRVFAEHGL